jgi:hypothetical protein|tara:strand:- start:1043 stop:1486 length:444 start_codon:yes stop_codon:yes gene_type:complete
MIGVVLEYLKALNNSKFFAGVVMIIMNIGSKYVTIELSKNQEQYLKNNIGRQFLIFAISWMGSRDILTALALTAIFTILADHLFNEQSKLCIIPRKYRRYEHLLDLDKNNEVTEEELKHAKEVLERSRKKVERQGQLKNLNNFITQV